MKRLLILPAVLALTLGMSACGSDGDDIEPPAGAVMETNPDGSGSITGNGGGSAGGGDGGGGGASLPPEHQQTVSKMSDCMRKRGYDMPDATPETPIPVPQNLEGKDPAQVNKDTQECANQANQ